MNKKNYPINITRVLLRRCFGCVALVLLAAVFLASHEATDVIFPTNLNGEEQKTAEASVLTVNGVSFEMISISGGEFRMGTDQTDPLGPPSGFMRVTRGGSFNMESYSILSSIRGQDVPGYRFPWIGFRLASSSTESSVLTANGVSFEMASIPGGEFQMGDDNGGSNTRPLHTVKVSGFRIGKTEVTQGLWKAVMGNNPSRFPNGDNYPVEQVSWYQCQTFIQKLNLMTGGNYRLPTEAEWEYACRAGTTGKTYGNVDAISWNIDNSGNTSHPIREKQPNSFGLYDMLGNVQEWCLDWYGDDYNSSFCGEPNEHPGHTVRVNSFRIGKTEVTRGLWKAVMGYSPSGIPKEDNYPVEMVSWNDCQEFILTLNMITGENFRLPTEAEWEYACRAGTTGDSYGFVNAIAWYKDNSGGTSHPVGQKQANAFGLYDMLGNVFEWCEDYYGSYSNSSQINNPTGPIFGSSYVIRGGYWNAPVSTIRSAYRKDAAPGYRSREGGVGFRLALRQI